MNFLRRVAARRSVSLVPRVRATALAGAARARVPAAPRVARGGASALRALIAARPFSGGHQKLHFGKWKYPNNSPYPIPPTGDTWIVAFVDPVFDPEQNALLPYTIDRSTGVTVMKYHAGKYAGEEIVIVHLSQTLEWAVPTPPPEHTFEESPIVKEPPHPSDPGQATGIPDIGVDVKTIIPPEVAEANARDGMGSDLY